LRVDRGTVSGVALDSTDNTYADDGSDAEPRAGPIYRACGNVSDEGLGAITLPEFETPILFWNPSRPSTNQGTKGIFPGSRTHVVLAPT
jgi:hypothetical protein